MREIKKHGEEILSPIINKFTEKEELEMNVKDVSKETDKPKDKLIAIFEKQKSLMEKYHVIEEEQGVGYGLIKGRKFDIDDIYSQELLKNFAWRVDEELTAGD